VENRPEIAQQSKPASFLRTLRRILVFARPHRGLLARVYALLALVGLCELAGPAILGRSIDLLLEAQRGSAAAPSPLRSVPLHAVAFLAVGLLGQLLNFRKELLRTRFNVRVLCDIRVRLYRVLQGLCFRFHDARHSGDLITRATRDLYSVHTLYSETIFLGAEILLLVFGSMALIAWTDWRLALLGFSTFPLAVLVILRATVRMRDLSRAASDQYDRVTRVVQENVTGVRVVKAFAREPAEIDKFDVESSGYLDRSLSAIRFFTSNLPLAGMLFNLAIPATLVGGAFLVRDGSIKVGEVAAVIFYLSKISVVLRLLNRVVQTLQEAASGGDRLFEVLDAAPHVAEPASPKRLPPAGKGEIELERVEFHYRPENPVLRGISIRLPAGKRSAIIGPTGCGKSSLANLLPRFYDVTGGAIRIDGVDVRELSLDELRRAVIPIFQDTFLFSMSIAENIAFGKPGASREDIERCARAAQIHDFVASLENGYETIVGERGVSLSGGQRQRIAIARAFLMEPRVLIMDDCTASVDAETEKKLQQAMEELSRGRTTVIIAQRFSTVLAADHIVFLDQGRVEAAGTHQELLASCPAYASLYHKQMRVTAGASGEAA
jgi:ATP-binding cassette subfamily B protein